MSPCRKVVITDPGSVIDSRPTRLSAGVETRWRRFAMQGRQCGQQEHQRRRIAPIFGVVLAAGCLLPTADLVASDRQNPWASAAPEVQRSAPERSHGRFPDRDYDPSRRAESREAPTGGYPPGFGPGPYGPHGSQGGMGSVPFHAPGGMPGGYPYGYPGQSGYPGMGGPFSAFPWGMGGFPFP